MSLKAALFLRGTRNRRRPDDDSNGLIRWLVLWFGEGRPEPKSPHFYAAAVDMKFMDCKFGVLRFIYVSVNYSTPK